MNPGVWLLVMLVCMLIGALPFWPHARTWGAAPALGLGIAIIVVAILVLLHQGY